MGSTIWPRCGDIAALIGCTFSFVTAGCTSTQAVGRQAAFEFGVIGDGPYVLATEAPFEAVIADMNRADLAFVLHVGDIQADARLPYSGGVPTCTDDSLRQRLEMFAKSRHPFILTPGDNKWTDCHFVKERVVDPLERLAKLRAITRTEFLEKW